MSKKSKIILCVIGIFLVTSILIGISYAYYIFSVSQESTNVVRSDCFEITFEDGNAIYLTNTIPLSDKDAKELEPYTFTIKNICNQAVDYSVNIETLNTSTMDLDAVATKLDGKKKQILGSLDDNENIVNNNATSSKTIYSNILKAGEEKTHNLRLWVDIDATMEQSASKEYESKVVVSGVLHPNYSEAILEKGHRFNSDIKWLATGVSQPEIGYSANSSIVSIQRSSSMPPDDITKLNVAASQSDKPIYAWFVDGIIYYYCENEVVFMNEDSSDMFFVMENLKTIDLSSFDTSKVINMGRMFYDSFSLESLDISNFDTSSVTNMSYMFSGLHGEILGLTSLDLSNFDTSNVTNMSWMFYNLSNVTELDLSNFDTSNVTNMSSMFSGMSNLISLDLSNFDTLNVTDMSYMFSSMSRITSLDLSSFDTSNVTKMNYMFFKMESLLSLDVSKFNTSNVTNMNSMFRNLESVSSLDLSNFDTSNVTDMEYMFSGNTMLENIDVSSFNTSIVTDMFQMFARCSSLTVLDLSSFDVSNVTSMTNIFSNMTSLITIYTLHDWEISDESNSNYLFIGSTSLVGGAGTTYDANHTDKEYARVDDPENGKPGYFTLKTT